MNLYVKTYMHTTLRTLIMRTSIMAILLTVNGLLMARSGSGQDLNKVMISIDLKNATLKQAFRKIESLTRVAFTYKTSDVETYDHINYTATNISLTRLLEDLLQNTDLKYQQVNSNIVIKKIRKNDQVMNVDLLPEELPFDGSIHGRVSDENGTPISNASAVLLGTDKGTAANSNGEFVISGVKAGIYKLQISAVYRCRLSHH